VRAILTGIGETGGVGSELLDDLKTAVSEAYNNAVLHAYPNGPGPIAIDVQVRSDTIRVLVRDRGVGIGRMRARAVHLGAGLAIMTALAQRVEFLRGADGGTVVDMSFARRPDAPSYRQRDEVPAFVPGPAAGAEDLVVTLSPEWLLRPLLGRACRALGPTAHLSAHRLADLSILADAIGAFAERSATPGTTERSASGRTSFSISAALKRFELTIAPCSDLAANSTNELALVAQLADEVHVGPPYGTHALRVLVADRGPGQVAQSSDDESPGVGP
jgi:anti-sigma regulatory factor (Ser/Thr protein kinase)